MPAERFKSLQHKHAELETMIAEEQRRPCPDMVVLHDLKKRKLHIREEMMMMGGQAAA